MVTADLDGHFLLKPLEESSSLSAGQVPPLVGPESAETCMFGVITKCQRLPPAAQSSGYEVLVSMPPAPA